MQSTASSGVVPADTVSSFFYGLVLCVAPVHRSLLAWSRSILSQMEKLFPSAASRRQQHRALHILEDPNTGRRSRMTLRAVLLSAHQHQLLLQLRGERLGTSLRMLVCHAVVPQSPRFETDIAQATQ